VKLFREAGNVGRTSGGGRPSIHTPETIQTVREIIENEPREDFNLSFVTPNESIFRNNVSCNITQCNITS
jgi:hypothetical protein